MEPLLSCLVLAVLATCTGVTHWRLQNGAITAVNSGHTVFTAAAPEIGSSPPCSSCSEESDVVYDRIFAVLKPRTTRGLQRLWFHAMCSYYFLPVRPQSTPVINQECPLISSLSQAGSAEATSNGLSPLDQQHGLHQQQCVKVLRDADGVEFM